MVTSVGFDGQLETEPRRELVTVDEGVRQAVGDEECAPRLAMDDPPGLAMPRPVRATRDDGNDGNGSSSRGEAQGLSLNRDGNPDGSINVSALSSPEGPGPELLPLCIERYSLLPSSRDVDVV